jgi:uncharacterized protein YgbK (DUF1537 family)
MKVVVFDDDPTGSQTVHGCPLLLRTDATALRQGLQHPSPLLFVLANSRALEPAAARERVAGICRSLGEALRRIAAEDARLAARLRPLVLVSRGDSTLRGHFPLELEVIEQELLGGPDAVDARFLVPAFLPGGRTTVDGIHLLHGQPVHTSAFGRDGLFGFDTSDLAAYIEAKSGGRVPAAAVQRLALAELEADPEALTARLAALSSGAWVVVDAVRPRHLEAFAAAALALMSPAAAARWRRPRRFLFQSAASLLNALVEPELGAPPLAGARLAALRRRDGCGRPGPGLVLVGSHVPLADAQLAHLLAVDPRCRLIEIEASRLARVLEGPAPGELLASLEGAWLARLRQVLDAGQTPVLASSRGELPCRSSSERRRLGLELAALMARLVGALAPRLGFVLSKGGITSHTLLESGLGCSAVALQGQLLPGLSLVLAGDLPVLTCPGNLGDAQTLQQALALMQAEQPRPGPGPGPPGC